MHHNRLEAGLTKPLGVGPQRKKKKEKERNEGRGKGGSRDGGRGRGREIGGEERKEEGADGNPQFLRRSCAHDMNGTLWNNYAMHATDENSTIRT